MTIRIAALALLMTAAVPAQAEWRQASTDHFVIYSEDSPKVLREFATKLERFDRAMRVMRGVDAPPPGPSNRLTVFVVPTMSSVQKLYGKGSANIGGFYMGRATGSIAITPRSGPSDQAQLILFHEYAHHFMMQHDAFAFPAWFVEGFAEFNATTRFDKDGSIGVGVPAHHRAYGLLSGAKLPLEKLMTSSVADLKAHQQEEIYGRGWLLTHYLMFDRGRSGQLKKYVLEINRGKPSLEAAASAFGDLKQLDKDLDAYLGRSKMTYMKIPPEKVQIGKVEVRELGPAEAAVMKVRIRSKRGVDETEAKALVPLARKAAAPYPDDVFAQTTLAETEYDAGNFAEAEAAADRALKTDPKASEALIYKGRARMALVSASRPADSKADADAWKDVRKWFLAANRADSADPEPMMLYYRSFLEEGTKPTANAAEGLTEALHLAPQDEGLRWMVAMQHLQDGKAAEARAALGPLAFDPHGGEGAEQAAMLIAKLDQGGTKGALEAMQSMSTSKDGAK